MQYTRLGLATIIKILKQRFIYFLLLRLHVNDRIETLHYHTRHDIHHTQR